MSQSEPSGDGTAATRHAAVSPWRRKQAEAALIWFLPAPAPALEYEYHTDQEVHDKLDLVKC